MGYIRFPVDVDPEVLIQDVYDFIQINAPQWKPGDGNLDTWIIRALMYKAAENRELASDVQDDIFRYLGASIYAIPPVDALQATVGSTWTAVDNAGYTIPAGTNVSILDASGNSYPFYVVADVVIAPGATTTAAGAVTLRALNPGAAANNLGGSGALATLIDVLAFVSSITLTGTTGGGADAESDAEYLNKLTRRLQRLSFVPILPEDFAASTLDASSEVDRAVAIDTYNPFHNLLTANQAGIETSSAGWAVSTNVTLAQTAAQATEGTKSLQMSSVAAGDMMAGSTPYTVIPVTPGNVYTAVGSFRAATAGRNCRLMLVWTDNGGASLGLNTLGTTVADITTGWTVATVSGVAPTAAKYVLLYAVVLGTGGAGEVHYVDKLQVRHGTTTDWVAGGTTEYGAERELTIAAAKVDGTPVSAQAKIDIKNYLQGLRETNFVVNVVDPQYTAIDVHADIKVATGWSPATVTSDVVTAINEYLSSANWGKDGDHTWIERNTVYYNELISLIDRVNGVDRVADLTSNIHGMTAGRADITIASPAGLTQPSTVTATAV